MTVLTSIFALEARSQRSAGPAEAPQDARISPRVVYPVVVAVSLLLWFALVELMLLLVRLPLFS
jgi:hypothetical protein